MTVYVTYFDSAYAARARVMIESLRATGDAHRVVAVVFDKNSERECLSWQVANLEIVPIAHVVNAYPRLDDVRASRSRAEWFFTCTPWVMRFVCDSVSEDDWVTYLDADLVFHANPQPIVDELNDADVGIIEHQFRADRPSLQRFGRYNVGWVSIRNSEPGRRVLKWWAERCLEWCRDTSRGGRFADQGYLDQFTTLIPTTHVITHPGANVAPWNLNSHTVSLSDSGRVLVDGKPLLFFHMHGVRLVNGSYHAMHRRFGTTSSPTVRDHIYDPYAAALVRAGDTCTPPPATRGRGLRGVMARGRRHWHYRRARADGDVWPVIDHG